MKRTDFLKLPYFEDGDLMSDLVEKSRWEKIDLQLMGLLENSNLVLEGMEIMENNGVYFVGKGIIIVDGIYYELNSPYMLTLSEYPSNKPIKAKIKLKNGEPTLHFGENMFDSSSGVLLGYIDKDGRCVNSMEFRIGSIRRQINSLERMLQNALSLVYNKMPELFFEFAVQGDDSGLGVFNIYGLENKSEIFFASSDDYDIFYRDNFTLKPVLDNCFYFSNKSSLTFFCKKKTHENVNVRAIIV